MTKFWYWLSQNIHHFSYLRKYAHALLKKAGIRTNGHFFFNAPIRLFPLDKLNNLYIGKGSFINSRTRFALASSIHIGERVAIGPNVMFETVNHLKGNKRVHESILKPIKIEDDVWIGAGAIILPGITVGRGAVVAAGSVVTKDVLPRTLIGGNPARLIRKLDE